MPDLPDDNHAAEPKQQEEPVLIQMSVKGLILDPISNTPIVVLRDESGTKFLPIWIGPFEASAIALTLEDVDPPRPMTHDLLHTVFTTLEGKVARIVISKLVDSTFFAQIVTLSQEGTRIIDSRPSDALALALRADAPIFVSEDVLEQSSVDHKAQQLQDDEVLKKYLEDLDEDDLGDYKM